MYVTEAKTHLAISTMVPKLKPMNGIMNEHWRTW